MEIKDEWLMLLAVDRPEGQTCEPVGKQTEIPAAGDRNLPPHQHCRRDGILDHVHPWVLIGKPRRIRDAVIVVHDREDARIIGKAKFAEDIQRPQRVFGD